MTPLSTLYNSLILKGLKFNNFLAKNCKPSIYRALEKRVESQVKWQIIRGSQCYHKLILIRWEWRTLMPKPSKKDGFGNGFYWFV